MKLSPLLFFSITDEFDYIFFSSVYSATIGLEDKSGRPTYFFFLINTSKY